MRLSKGNVMLPLFLLLTMSVAGAQQRPELTGSKGTIPRGTVVNVRVTDSLTSETASPGDAFHGTLLDDLEVNGKVIFPRGSEVTGRVTDAKASGRLSTPGLLELTLTKLEASNVTAKLVTEPLKVEGESHTKSNTTKIGAGAAAGAIIGAIAGGGKGAAIGTVVGGAAGTGAAAATGRKEASVESEAVLSFTTSVDVLATLNESKTGDVRSYDDEIHLKVRGAAATQAQSPTQTAQATTPVQASTATPAAGAPVAPVAAAPTAAGTSTVAATTVGAAEFSARDRRVLRSCLTGDTGELPAALAKMEQLPAGQANPIQKNGTLPEVLAKRAQALPLACESQLPKLPSNMERVVLNRQVLLINTQNHIYDIASLEQ